LVGGAGGEAEDGGEGVDGVDGGDGMVEEKVEFAGEVGCGLDEGVLAREVWVDGTACEGGEGVLEFGVDGEGTGGEEREPVDAGSGMGFEVREEPVEVWAVREVAAAYIGPEYAYAGLVSGSSGKLDRH
jgi:hypothetical protein